jgi:hypothetical protein
MTNKIFYGAWKAWLEMKTATLKENRKCQYIEVQNNNLLIVKKQIKLQDPNECLICASIQGYKILLNYILKSSYSITVDEKALYQAATGSIKNGHLYCFKLLYCHSKEKERLFNKLVPVVFRDPNHFLVDEFISQAKVSFNTTNYSRFIYQATTFSASNKDQENVDRAATP